MARKSPRTAAQELLARLGSPNVPTDVVRAANVMGAQVVARPLAAETSGMLVRADGATVIGVNANHAEVRRRFSIAHELGHLSLHPGRPLLLHETVRVNFRDAVSSMATDIEEIEANAFAAELLMPESLVRQEMMRTSKAARPELIRRLAGTFAVSKPAMEIRLVNLGIIAPK